MTDATVATIEEPSSFLAREPVLLLHALASLVFYAATSVGLDQAGAARLVNLIVPAAVVVILMLQAFVIRHFVTPAWKAIAKKVKQETGIDLSEGTVARVEAALGLTPVGIGDATPPRLPVPSSPPVVS
jgi:hypothetical protein